MNTPNAHVHPNQTAAAQQKAAELNITTFNKSKNIARLFGIDEVTFNFQDDDWDLGTHPRRAATTPDRSLHFDDVPVRYRPLTKMLVVARLNPQAVADLIGNGCTAQQVTRIFGPRAKSGNPTTATVAVGTLRPVLKLLQANGYETVASKDWTMVTDLIKNDVAKGTARKRIDVLCLLDRFARLLGDTALKTDGVFGSTPFNGKTSQQLVSLDSEEAAGVNKVKPNPDVFKMFGFTSQFIATCADDIIDAVAHFRTPNSKGNVRPDHREVREFAWHDGDYGPHASRVWSQRLMDACFFDIAVSFALRPRDIACLDRDCVRDTDDGLGFIRGWRTKNVAPVETRFPAMPKAVNTISVVNRLLDAYGVTKQDTPLIPNIPKTRHRLFTHYTRNGAGTITWTRKSFERVQDAARDLHAWGQLQENLDSIEKQITMREMRVTALAHYANRQFGASLAALFAKHGSKRQLSGYIGGVSQQLIDLNTSHVRPDVEDPETQQEIVDLMVEMAPPLLVQAARRDREEKDGEGSGLTGNGLWNYDRKRNDPDVDGVFVELDTDRHKLFNQQPLTAREQQMIKKRNQNVEAGLLTLCLFEPGNALCGGKGSADFRLCQPNRCANSVTSPGNRALYELQRRFAVASGDPFLKVRVVDVIARDYPADDHYPGMEAEFKGKTDDELIDLYLEEADELVRLVVDGPRP